jgi:HK97 family phage prohead protease
MLRCTSPFRVRQVADRQCRAILSSGQPGRDHLVVDVAGIDLDAYKRNPIVLFGHDQLRPVARCWPSRNGNGQLEGTITWPPEGASDNADESYELVKAGVIKSVSIGFEPHSQTRPDPRDGVSVVRACTLMEVSLVALPADTGAVITERSYRRSRPSLADLQFVSRETRRAEALALRWGPEAGPLAAPVTCDNREAYYRQRQEHFWAVTEAAVDRALDRRKEAEQLRYPRD